MPGKRVLVVDDYEDTRELYGEYLRFAGYDAVTAADGSTALEYARQQKWDVIVLDIALPRLDGLTVLRHLRSDASTRDVPVIVLSASVREHVRAEALATGANLFLPKPCAPDELEGAIRKFAAGRGDDR
jgi:two-component system cell cycle response regulator DivK